MPLTPQDFVSKWKRGTADSMRPPPDPEGGKRTRTNPSNARPTWLDLAHKPLDEAVFAAYGWPSDLSDEDILEKLLALGSLRCATGVLRKFGEK